MAVVYCKTCSKACLDSQALKIGPFRVCSKCRKLMMPMRGEEAHISEQVVADLREHGINPASFKTARSTKIYDASSINLVLAECLDQLRHNPQDVKALVSLAKIYFTKNDLSLAKQYLEKALSVDTNCEEALSLMLKLNPKKAAQVNLENMNVEDVFNECVRLYNDQQFEEAFYILKQCVEKHPLELEFRKLFASVCFELGDFPTAVKHLNVLKGSTQNKAYVEFNLGVVFFAQEKFLRAKACFKEAFSHTKDKELSDQCRQFIEVLEAKV